MESTVSKKADLYQRNNRVRYVDIARGISIICIILGHLGVSSINRFVFTFHVPVFFLISGYFFDEKSNWKVFTGKKVKTLIVPYVTACLLIIISAVFFNQILNQGLGDKAVIKSWIGAALYGAGDNYSKPFVIKGIGAIWFLLAMFWASLMMKLLLGIRNEFRFLIVLAIFFIADWSRKRFFWFPLSIQAGGTALLFIYIGYLSKYLNTIFRQIENSMKFVLLGFAAWVWIEFIINFKSFWLVHCDHGRGVVDIFGSLCGSVCILSISYLIDNKTILLSRGLAFLGKYSLLMLCMHIIELDTINWRWLLKYALPFIPDQSLLAFIITGKLIWCIGLTYLLSKWNFTRRLFGYSSR